MKDFSFVRNEKLRSVIERDFRELERLSTDTETKAAVVLAGSILEGLLVDALTVAGKWDFDSACQQILSDLIRPARTLGIIQHDNLSQVVKDYRHLVHPGREIRKGIRLTQEQADLAKAAVNVIIQDISRWYDTPSGKAAVALQLPTASVPFEKQRTFLRASEHSIDVRITCALGSTFLLFLTNNSDEAFDIAAAMVELDGAGLGNVTRPQRGVTWTVLPGKGIDVRWPDPCHAMFDLVRKRGKFEAFQYTVAIDIILECVFDDEQRQLKKRVLIQVDPVNKSATQL
jgi:hypothetical protein